MLSGTEEIQIIISAVKGNQKSFNLLYKEHVDSLFRFLNQFSTDRELVKDWTQRTFIKAFDKLESFKRESRFKTWLFKIGLNEMRSDLRSKIYFEEIPESETISLEDPEPFSETWGNAREVIRRLSPDKRMILLLHVAEGYSHKEIAEMLAIKEGTSRIMLHRAKEELRKHKLL